MSVALDIVIGRVNHSIRVGTGRGVRAGTGIIDNTHIVQVACAKLKEHCCKFIRQSDFNFAHGP
jgi:hypothetical protein